MVKQLHYVSDSISLSLIPSHAGTMSCLNVVGDTGNFVVFFATLEGFHHAWTQAAAEYSNDVFTTNSMPHFFTFVSEQLIKFIQRYGTGFEFRPSVFCGINGIYAPYKVCGGSQLLLQSVERIKWTASEYLHQSPRGWL